MKAREVTTRMDYNPERCKDYYEHGYCTFGDTCIFIHDRGDYKSGFQLDAEWDALQRKKQRAALEGRECSEDESDYEIKSEKEEQDTICLICEADFVEPVQTLCGHVFCEKCALRHNKKHKGCFKCGKETNGTFKDYAGPVAAREEPELSEFQK